MKAILSLSNYKQAKLGGCRYSHFSISLFLYLLNVLAHRSLGRRLRRINAGTMGVFIGACFALACIHIWAVGMYTFAFILGESIGLGTFNEVESMSAADIFYFSLVNFTTLGLGPAYPTGHLRFIAGFEAFNGFLSITLSASTLFQLSTTTAGSSEE